MNNSINDKIQKEIDLYFENLFISEYNIFRELSINIGISFIWRRICAQQKLTYCEAKTDGYRNIEDLFEEIKIRSGIENLSIEHISEEFFNTTIHLPNSDWFLREGQEGFYILPMWKSGQINSCTYIRTPKSAKLILAFDTYIPQILERAENAILKQKEIETTCKIIKASAEGIIKTLIADKSIDIPEGYYVTCSNPHRFEVMIPTSSKWIVSTLDELKPLLLKRYAKSEQDK